MTNSVSSPRIASHRWLFVAVFLVGAAVRFVDVWRPVYRPIWRECDLAAVARNYYREGMNLLYPRIDWRGNGPGYTEMEFPLYPWTIALLYKAFGIHEAFGRLISFGLSLVTMAFFFRLARSLLSPAGAIGAAVFFALSRLVVFISHAIQPEALMFCCYVIAVYAFLRWLEDDSQVHYYTALVATALAILAKAPAAHIGIFLAIVLLQEKGLAALRRLRVWLFAIGSLLPAALWYGHAYNFWRTYGNSLGVSNQDHWIGRDFFTNPSFLLGIITSEIRQVWTPPGLIIVAAAVLWSKSRKAVRIAIVWLLAVFVYYILAARTTADIWAFYYHVVSAPAVAILLGAGVEVLAENWRPRLLALMAGFGIIATVLWIVVDRRNPAEFPLRSWAIGLSVLFISAYILLAALKSDAASRTSGGPASTPLPWLQRLAIPLVAACLLPTIVFEVRSTVKDLTYLEGSSLLACAKSFSPLVPANSLILASGAACRGRTGRPVAYNSSYMFYWMDRKGFNICEEEQSLDTVNAFAARGAAYFVAEKSVIGEKAGFEADLRKSFPLVSECRDALLFRLRDR